MRVHVGYHAWGWEPEGESKATVCEGKGVEGRGEGSGVGAKWGVHGRALGIVPIRY